MPGYDLRPLTLGEVLDRTFSLYRERFLLFAGIAAIPQLFVLAIDLLPSWLPPDLGGSSLAMWGVSFLVFLVVYLLAYLVSQGATVLAVSEIYLGRSISIGASLRRVWSEILPLFGVIVLNALVCGVAMIALIVPGVYLACRLLVCVPSALIEQRGPRDSLGRSFNLTRGYAGRAFLIMLLYLGIAMAIGGLVAFPAGWAAAVLRDPEKIRPFMLMTQFGQALANVVTQPILLIATAVFYYDLRVRKEAFDLQFMMDPTSEGRTSSPTGLPSILS